MCVCVCVCVRERERERESKRARARERERGAESKTLNPKLGGGVSRSGGGGAVLYAPGLTSPVSKRLMFLLLATLPAARGPVVKQQ